MIAFVIMLSYFCTFFRPFVEREGFLLETIISTRSSLQTLLVKTFFLLCFFLELIVWILLSIYSFRKVGLWLWYTVFPKNRNRTYPTWFEKTKTRLHGEDDVCTNDDKSCIYRFLVCCASESVGCRLVTHLILCYSLLWEKWKLWEYFRVAFDDISSEKSLNFFFIITTIVVFFACSLLREVFLVALSYPRTLCCNQNVSITEFIVFSNCLQ